MYIEQSKNGYLWLVKQIDNNDDVKILKVYTNKDSAKLYIDINKAKPRKSKI